MTKPNAASEKDEMELLAQEYGNRFLRDSSMGTVRRMAFRDGWKACKCNIRSEDIVQQTLNLANMCAKEKHDALDELAKEKARAKELLEALGEAIFALGCTIIRAEGKVPGLTDQQLYDGCVIARDKGIEIIKKYREGE